MSTVYTVTHIAENGVQQKSETQFCGEALHRAADLQYRFRRAGRGDLAQRVKITSTVSGTRIS